MTAPVYATTPYLGYDRRQIIRFGGLPVPVTGQVLPWMDLNDLDAWHAGPPKIDGNHISNKASQLTWRAKGVWTAQDFLGRKISVPVLFDEGNSAHDSFAARKYLLTMSGEQYLTFDNVTAMRVRCNSFTEQDFLTEHPPYLIKTTLEFLSRNPFAEDIGGNVILGPTPNGANSSGVHSTWNINYAGHAWGEPVITINVPAASGKILNVGVSNVTSGEDIEYQPVGGFPIGGGHAIVFDSTLQSIKIDATEVAPNIGVGFPYLYPGFPPPLNNVLQVYLKTDGASFNASVSIQYANKWEF